MVAGYSRLLLSGLYTPHYDSNFNNFMSKIENLINNNVQSSIVLTGDLSLNILVSNSIKVSQYINLLTSYALENTIDLPTYVIPGQVMIQHISIIYGTISIISIVLQLYLTLTYSQRPKR